ncbi:unnamed protein product [Auanema sp. JU1783]|nr:unnamed protein product [Auanema sp. JU1783]
MRSPNQTFGSCQAMCSSEEVDFRQKNKLIHPLESLDPTVPHKELVCDPSKMVKEYVRSAAGISYDSESNIRTMEVLSSTTDYLISLYQELKETELCLVFSFVSDRLRAVRQDIIIKNVWNAPAILILEKMIPFYLETLCLGLFKPFSSFELVLHSTQLHECFSKWLNANKKEERDPTIIISFLIFVYYDMPYDNSFYRFLNCLNDDMRSLVIRLLNAFKSCNYVRFFRLLKLLPSNSNRESAVYLIQSLRSIAVDRICIAYKCNNAKLPKSLIYSCLGYSEQDCIGLSSIDSSQVLVSDLKNVLSTYWPSTLYSYNTSN